MVRPMIGLWKNHRICPDCGADCTGDGVCGKCEKNLPLFVGDKYCTHRCGEVEICYLGHYKAGKCLNPSVRERYLHKEDWVSKQDAKEFFSRLDERDW